MISTLYYARAAYIASKLCHVIGDFEEEHYSTLFLNIRNAFRQQFIDADEKIVSDTQSAYVIAYKSGIIDKAMAEKNQNN